MPKKLLNKKTKKSKQHKSLSKHTSKHTRKHTRKHISKHTRKHTIKNFHVGGNLDANGVLALDKLFRVSRNTDIFGFKLEHHEFTAINMNKATIKPDGNCTYYAIAHALNKVKGFMGISSQFLRNFVADNVDDVYCLTLLFMAYSYFKNKAITPNVKEEFEGTRNILLNENVMKYFIETNEDADIFFEFVRPYPEKQNVDAATLIDANLIYYDIEMKRKLYTKFINYVDNNYKRVQKATEFLRALIRRNSSQDDIHYEGQTITEGTINDGPVSVMYLDNNIERPILLNTLNIINIEINNDTHFMTIFKGPGSKINLSTLCVIMITNRFHTDGYADEVAYEFRYLPKAISEPITRILTENDEAYKSFRENPNHVSYERPHAAAAAAH
jgi:hypothetical protein